MISCVRSLVCVIQHGTWRGCSSRVPMNENTGAGSSPGCSASTAKSMVRPSRRGGVPVFSRPAGKLELAQARRRALPPADRRRARRRNAIRPTWISPDRKVPVVSTTASRVEPDAELGDDAGDAGVGAVAIEGQVVDRLLEQREVGMVFEAGADRLLVEQPVGLRARRAHRRALAGIQYAELDAGLVGGERHRAAQRVDFLDEVALADPADRRIARHLPQGFDVVRQQQRAAHPSAPTRAPPRCRHGRHRRRSHRIAYRRS